MVQRRSCGKAHDTPERRDTTVVYLDPFHAFSRSDGRVVARGTPAVPEVSVGKPQKPPPQPAGVARVAAPSAALRPAATSCTFPPLFPQVKTRHEAAV